MGSEVCYFVVYDMEYEKERKGQEGKLDKKSSELVSSLKAQTYKR